MKEQLICPKSDGYCSINVAGDNLSTQSEKEPHPLARMLTDRERQILELIAEGLDNKYIAKRLYVSESTVKNHVSNILSKLQLENRVQAAVFAAQEGFIKPRD